MKKTTKTRIVGLGLGVMAALFGMSFVNTNEAQAAAKNVYVTKGESQDVKVKKATKEIKWKVAKPSVLKVKSGKEKFTIQAKTTGTTVVSGKVDGKNYKFKVTVEIPEISETEITVPMGKTAVLEISGTKRKVNWQSDDFFVARIDAESGEITPNTMGDTYVYAKIGKKKYKCTVNVEDTIEMNELKIPNGENTIYGKMYAPKEEGTYPVIIMCHGYNGIADDFTKESQYYARNGYIAYAFDFCGGSARSRSTGMKTTDMTLFTEKSDLLTVFDYFYNMSGVDKDRIYIMGGSQGGLVTALAAEELKDKARAMVLYFPALGVPDNWRNTYPDETKIPEVTSFWGMDLGKNFFMSMRDLYPFDVIGGFEKPVYIFQGDKDNIVPLSSSQEAVKKYQDAKLKVMKGEGHGFTPAAGQIVMEEVLKFMEENK